MVCTVQVNPKAAGSSWLTNLYVRDPTNYHAQSTLTTCFDYQSPESDVCEAILKSNQTAGFCELPENKMSSSLVGCQWSVRDKMTLAKAITALIACSGSVSRAMGNSIIPDCDSLMFKGPIAVEADGMANIHVVYNLPIDGELSIHYGDCSVPLLHPKDRHHHKIGVTTIGSHPSADRHIEWKDKRPERFVWLVPEDAPDMNCLHAYSGDYLVGRSDPVTVTKRKARRSVAFADVVDAEGPWFDGVQYLKEKEPDSVFVAEAKSKKIGILGAGMSGLLCSVGLFLPLLSQNLGKLGVEDYMDTL